MSGKLLIRSPSPLLSPWDTIQEVRDKFRRQKRQREKVRIKAAQRDLSVMLALADK